MDRELNPSERRAGIMRRAAPVLCVVVLATGLVAALPSLLTPNVDRSAVRLARVDRGAVSVVIEAMGTVEPASERVVSSPVDSRLLGVLRRPGDRVSVGDRVVELDDSAVRAELARLSDRVATLRLDREQAALAHERDLDDLRQRAESRRLERDVARSNLARWQRLRAEGLASEDKLEDRVLELRRAELDVSGLDRSLLSAARSGAAKLAGVDLEVQQARRAHDEQARLVELSQARVESAGVVTWVLDDAGATVVRGAPLARIAQLDSYRVEARTSDVQAPRLAEGLPVRVRAPGLEIAGTIGSVSPAVAAGVLTFEVNLAEPAHAALRPSLRVDVWVTTDERVDVLRVARPAGSSAGSRAEVFVVEGSMAIRREVSLGVAGPDRVEVVAGLSEGDEVIVSDVAQWRGAEALRLE